MMNGTTLPDISTQPSPQPKKSSTKIILIVGIIIVLCCLCLLLAGLFYYLGTRGTGPLAMLATDTPTLTNTPTRTPTVTPSPTQEITLVGDWVINFDWDCDGSSNTGDMFFYDDYSYNVNDDPSLWGTWFIIDDYVDFTFNEYPNTHYTGTLSDTGDYMDGEMSNLDGMTGCWYATR